jgi:hypothetical protein
LTASGVTTPPIRVDLLIFVSTCSRDAHRTLLVASWMGRHHHAVEHALGPYRDLRAIVEAAHRPTFWTLLQLIRGQMQTRLDKRVIEHRVVFAADHEREASQIAEDGSGPILPVEPEQGSPLWDLVRREIA